MRRTILVIGAVTGILALLAAARPVQAAAVASATDAAKQVDKLLAKDKKAAAVDAEKSADTKNASGGSTEKHGAYPAPSESNKAPAAGSAASTSSAGKDKKPSASASANQPAKIADDATFLRRVSLDLAGQPPSPSEIAEFSADRSPDKRAKLVDKLLASPRFGENWANYWRDVILFRRADERARLVGPALVSFLTEQFNKDVPWDQIARSFITATGDIRENGATGIIMAQAGNSADVTAEVSRIFMGIQIQCAQCHDHPTDRWKRSQFHELAAFFPRIALLPKKATDGEKRTFEVYGVDRDRQRLVERLKKQNQPYPELEHHMPDLKNPTAAGTQMQPIFFVTGQTLPLGESDADRRGTIARWITDPKDPWFARAMVNRVWAELVGEGFYEPVDDIGPDRDCNAPGTLDYLAEQFVAHKYDTKWLFRTIVATDAYQRESRSRHLPGETPFEANCPQLLRGDELFDSLVAALGLRNERIPPPGANGPGAKGAGKGGAKADGKTDAKTDAKTAGKPGAKADKKPGAKYGQDPRNVRALFDSVFNYDPSVRRDEVAGSIPQALVLMNAPQLARAESATGPTQLAKLLETNKDDTAVVGELYLRCLNRQPKSDEVKTCLEYVKKTGDRSQAFEDILWALVNSTEFLHRK